jgi:hypothetical protein
MSPTAPRDPALPPDETTLNSLLTALKGLQFGAIEITVHDGRIVQIERREKVRLRDSAEERRR